MKKVIALTLVMAVSAFAANMNVSFEMTGATYNPATGAYDMAVGDTGQIQMVLQGDTSDPLFVGNLLFNVTGADVLDIVDEVNWEYSDDEDVWGDMNIFGTETPDTMLGCEGFYLSFYGPELPVTEPTVFFSFDVEAIAEGDITIDLYDHGVAQSQYNSWATELAMEFSDFGGETTPITIHVPEPASLALLAIGGLAVIRRR